MLRNKRDNIHNYRDSRILEKIHLMEIKYSYFKMGVKATNRKLNNSSK